MSRVMLWKSGYSDSAFQLFVQPLRPKSEDSFDSCRAPNAISPSQTQMQNSLNQRSVVGPGGFSILKAFIQ